MGLLKFVVWRVAFGILTLLVVSIVVFAFTQILPSDPARAILGREATPESLTAKREELGFNKPAVQQYTDWLKGLLTGDPGKSYANGQPILDFLGDRIKNSLFLMACAGAISIPLSIVIGAYAALRRDKAFDRASSVGTLFFASLTSPEFVLGALLIFVFATNVFHVLPATVRIRPGEPPWSDPKAMILPVLLLTLAVVPYVSRVMRASMIEVLESDYVEMARLKGVPERTVLWRHAMPNAIGPTFQVIALNIAYLFGGVIVVETLFNYNGIGRALVDAVREVNLPVVQFLAMFIAAIYVVTNLLADIGTILVTPRLRTRLS
jgi:peptide/nickel transport system permease protein